MTIKSVITSPKTLALLAQAVASGGNFALGVLLARWLGLAAFGQYSLLWMGVLFLLSLHQAYFTQPLMALLAGKNVEEQPRYLKSLTGLQVLLSAVLPLLALLAFLGIKTLGIEAEWLPWLPVTGLLLSAYLLQEFTKRYCFAKKLNHVPLLMDASLFGLLLPSLAALYFLGKLSLGTALMALTAAYALSFVLGAKLADIHPFKDWKIANLKHTAKEHYHYSFWLLGTSLVQWFSGNFFLVAAAGTLGTVALGALRMAQNMVGLCHVIFLAMENIVPAEAARQYFSSGEKAMFAYLRRVGLLAGIPVGLLLAGFTLAAPWLIGWLYGTDYQAFAYLVGLFAVVYALGYVATLQRFALRSMQYTSPMFIAYAVSAAVSVLAAGPVVRQWGIGGVMAGLMGAQVLMLLVYGFFILKKTNNRGKASTNPQATDNAHSLTLSPSHPLNK